MTQLEVALVYARSDWTTHQSVRRRELCPPKSIGECGLGLARGGKKREHNRHARETGKRAANFNALLHT